MKYIFKITKKKKGFVMYVKSLLIKFEVVCQILLKSLLRSDHLQWRNGSPAELNHFNTDQILGL